MISFVCVSLTHSLSRCSQERETKSTFMSLHSSSFLERERTREGKTIASHFCHSFSSLHEGVYVASSLKSLRKGILLSTHKEMSEETSLMYFVRKQKIYKREMVSVVQEERHRQTQFPCVLHILDFLH